MRAKRKALILLLCMVTLIASTMMGAMAYLTDQDSNTNTFTVGTVKIKLDETDVKTDGTKDTDERVAENTYHLIPGHTYIKDPMVTVLKGSEECYVRMLVTCTYSKELDVIFAPTGADLTSIFVGYDGGTWCLHEVEENIEDNTRTYEFRYVGSAHQGIKTGTVKAAESDNIALDPLFDGIKIPGEITKEQLATLVKTDADGKIEDQFTITVVAHAIQADGFADADLAWEKFQ